MKKYQMFKEENKLKRLWHKYIGKYKIVDSSKGRFIPYNNEIFVLSEKQSEQIKDKYYKKYIFIPTAIGYIFKVEDLNNNIIDLTDYETW